MTTSGASQGGIVGKSGESVKKNPDKAPNRNHLLDLRDVYQTLPVDATGYLKGSGDPKLDGEVKDAIDLAERLGKSRRVRQSIIRHAFRYFLGRNESLSDSKTLIDADQAYVESRGSFDALVVSLLTSDSFVYRQPIKNKLMTTRRDFLKFSSLGAGALCMPSVCSQNLLWATAQAFHLHPEVERDPAC